jgi:antitoxin component of MazEF toxin-antitoxin module
MSVVSIGRWGKNLAVRLPRDAVKASGFADGQRVEVEARTGEIVIRRALADEEAAAQQAAEEILAEGEKHSLGGLSPSELVNEGRR